jgi:2-polyprenyl-3-methyl-5-hydroxy-6-metoxy-1,4-benzoquinol methylase
LIPCVVCGGETSLLKDKQLPVTYHVCTVCDFISKDESLRLSNEVEQLQYDRHNNTMESTGYVDMFKELIKEYIEPLAVTRNVLDFGSGPGPVLYELLAEEGYNVSHYDPFYHPDVTYKESSFQLITSTEVVEHFFDPVKEFLHLSNLLEEGGYLLIMTHIRNKGLDVFLHWWYRRDVTHVSFYHLNTLEYIARVCGLEIIKHNNKNIILFKKK